MRKNIIKWASSNPWALITLLYSLKWILGQLMLVYLSISSILKWDGKLATVAPSKSSQLIAPSETLICLILCSSLSIRACASSKAWMGAMTGSGVASAWLCKTYNARCGTNWLSGGGGGAVESYYALSWGGTCGAYLRIYPLAEAGYSLLNWSHGRDKLIHSDYLGVYISPIYSLVWLIWYSGQLASNSSARRRIQIGHQKYSYKHGNTR